MLPETKASLSVFSREEERENERGNVDVMGRRRTKQEERKEGCQGRVFRAYILALITESAAEAEKDQMKKNKPKEKKNR